VVACDLSSATWLPWSGELKARKANRDGFETAYTEAYYTHEK
jgi:hypothetical protein